MHGLHLIADLHDCRCAPDFLRDGPGLEAFCVAACTRHGLTVVGRLFHPFRDAAGAPAGVTGPVVLAESHLAVHTWPDRGGVTLDVFVCNFSENNSAKAEHLLQQLLNAFAPQRHVSQRIDRGC